MVAVAVLGRSPAGISGQWLAQLVGVTTVIGIVLPLAYLLNWILNRLYLLSISTDKPVRLPQFLVK